MVVDCLTSSLPGMLSEVTNSIRGNWAEPRSGPGSGARSVQAPRTMINPVDNRFLSRTPQARYPIYGVASEELSDRQRDFYRDDVPIYRERWVHSPPAPNTHQVMQRSPMCPALILAQPSTNQLSPNTPPTGSSPSSR